MPLVRTICVYNVLDIYQYLMFVYFMLLIKHGCIKKKEAQGRCRKIKKSCDQILKMNDQMTTKQRENQRKGEKLWNKRKFKC